MSCCARTIISPPRVSLDRSSPKGVQEGATASTQSQPPPPPPLSISEQLTRDWYRLVAARKCSCGAIGCSVCRAADGAAFFAAPDSGSGCDGRGTVASTTPPWRDEPAPRVFGGRSRHGSRCPCGVLAAWPASGQFQNTNAAQTLCTIDGRIADYFVVRRPACTVAHTRCRSLQHVLPVPASGRVLLLLVFYTGGASITHRP
jgi:hypothetical protein